jgi:TonB family protein
MFSDKTFQIAFLISVIAHGFVLLQNSNVAIFPPKKNEQKFQVSYIKPVEEPKVYPKSEKPKKEQFLKIPSKITVDKRTPPPFIDKEEIFNKAKEIMSLKKTFTKPDFIKSDVVVIQKKITMPPIDLDKINNPSYISYYQLIREKIRRAAYRNYTRNETGEVYLSFIISSDGYLKEVRFSEERSSSNPYLKEIAMRSIKEASPFPNFPKELDYSQLSFNVIISFEIE